MLERTWKLTCIPQSTSPQRKEGDREDKGYILAASWQRKNIKQQWTLAVACVRNIVISEGERTAILSNDGVDSRKALDSYGEIQTTTNHSYCPERERERERERRREGEREREIPKDSERVSESNALHWLTHEKTGLVWLVKFKHQSILAVIWLQIVASKKWMGVRVWERVSNATQQSSPTAQLTHEKHGVCKRMRILLYDSFAFQISAQACANDVKDLTPLSIIWNKKVGERESPVSSLWDSGSHVNHKELQSSHCHSFPQCPS